MTTICEKQRAEEGLLLASLGDEGVSRAMQIETSVQVIEKKLK